VSETKYKIGGPHMLMCEQLAKKNAARFAVKAPAVTKKRNKKLEAEITRLYNKHAVDCFINVMDIGHVFRAGEAAFANGTSVENAIHAACIKYTRAGVCGA